MQINKSGVHTICWQYYKDLLHIELWTEAASFESNTRRQNYIYGVKGLQNIIRTIINYLAIFVLYIKDINIYIQHSVCYMSASSIQYKKNTPLMILVPIHSDIF